MRMRLLALGMYLAVAGCGGDDVDRTRLAAGALDPGFGTDGIVLADFGAGHNRINAVVPLPDGRILVGGTASRGGLSIALARYDAAGALDPSFGDGGVVVTLEAQGPDRNGAELRDLVRTPSGDIVALACVGVIPPCDWAVARYSADGVLDRSFGGGVVFLTGDRSPSAVVATSDGGVVVLGNGFADDHGGPDYVLWKLTATGEIDRTFGAGGRVAIDVAEDEGEALLPLPDGRLLVGGCTGEAFTLLRLLPNGTLDGSFGRAGVAIYDDPSLAGTITTIASGPDGTFVAGGIVDHAEAGAIVRVDGDGALDPRFGVGGIAPLGPARRFDVRELVLERDGAVLATAGIVDGAGIPAFAVLRLAPDGVPDADWGPDGILTTRIGDLAESTAIGIAPDGGILVGGLAIEQGNVFFALARYLDRSR